MHHLLLALVFSLAGVCLAASPTFALPAADLKISEENAGKPALEMAPGDVGVADSSSSAPSDSSQSSDSASNDEPGSALSREELCTLLASVAGDNGLPVGFFMRLIWQESGFKRTAVSPAGALGVAQFMPAVAASLGVRDPFDPREAVPASARLLRGLHAQFGNLGLAAAAYNAGPRRVLNWLAKRSALPKETRNYVQIITGTPAEHWTKTRSQLADVQVPSRVPCVQVASSSGAEKPAGSRLPGPVRTAVKQVAAIKQVKVASLAQKLRAKVSTLARHGTSTSRDRRGPRIIKVADLRTRSSRVGDRRRAS